MTSHQQKEPVYILHTYSSSHTPNRFILRQHVIPFWSVFLSSLCVFFGISQIGEMKIYGAEGTKWPKNIPAEAVRSQRQKCTESTNDTDDKNDDVVGWEKCRKKRAEALEKKKKHREFY